MPPRNWQLEAEMAGSRLYGSVLLGLVLVSCADGGCNRGERQPNAGPETPADRDSRRGGVSRAPLPPPVAPGGVATRPAGEGSTVPGPAPAPAGEEALGGVTGHTFAGFENARSVVFVCDGTGTMVTKLRYLRAELTEAINRLKPEQSFN